MKTNKCGEMECVIEFHKDFVGASDLKGKFAKAIKRDFGMDCKIEDDKCRVGRIVNNHVVKVLTVKDIFKLDAFYGILCFEEPNKIILR